MGLLSWSPDTFWKATPYDFWYALNGLRRSKGLDKPAQNTLNDQDRNALIVLVEQHKAIDAASARKKANDAK